MTPKRVARGRVQVPKRQGAPGQSALDVLRTVEFRQTLRGYHIDDVDHYLECVAMEVDALAGRAPATGGGAGPHEVWTAAAVLTCMDARVDRSPVLCQAAGHAQVLRNAGGVVTDDVIRSLVISQRRRHTHRIVVVQHTDCALLALDDAAFLHELHRETGGAPSWHTGAFTDVFSSVRQACAALRDSPFLPHRHEVRGFVYDVGDGRLTEVEPSGALAPADAGGAGGQRAWSGWW